jgi:hypothetical protein
MNRQPNQKKVKARVVLTDRLWKHLVDDILKDSVPELARRSGLPYLLVYNIVHKRVKSLSARHYRMLFGESPPLQNQEKTDGTRFRELIDLWLLLNDGVTKAGLYREFYGPGHTKRVDYRIFTGQTQSIDIQFLKHLEKKFAACGIGPETAQSWAREWAADEREELVTYARIRPLLSFLQDTLGVHPTMVLNQWFQRYESGELKKISPRVYHKVLELKQKTEKALASGNRLALQKLKEEVYGRKPGYTLYAQIAEELKFLQRFARKSPKAYLGRSISVYATGECKRLPSWRARKIIADCRNFIRQEPRLPLAALPRAFRTPVVLSLTALLKTRTAELLSREEGIQLEKLVLKPAHTSDEYKKQIYGFTRFDMAGKVLGMNRKAFDLMVAKNCEIFRKIGTYSRRWYLSDLYLKELSQKQYFELITAKYEWLAKRRDPSKPLKACLN